MSKLFDSTLVSIVNDELRPFESYDITFSKSIEINPKLYDEINKVYVRTLNNQAKSFIGYFHLNIFKCLEDIIRTTNEPDDFIFDLSDFIANYFDEVEDDLNIKNFNDFNELMIILKLSSILINDALDENDMELIYEPFYQIESRLKKEKLIINEIDSNHFKRDFIDVKYEFSDSSKPIENYNLR